MRRRDAGDDRRSLQHHGALIEELRIAASSESFQNVFYAWFIFDRPITNDGQCLADVFLSGHRLRMKEVSVNFLEHMRSSSLRPYVVCEVELEKGLVLRDLRDDMFVRVLERAATRYARHGATLFARVIEGPSGEPEMHGVLSFAAANMGKM